MNKKPLLFGREDDIENFSWAIQTLMDDKCTDIKNGKEYTEEMASGNQTEIQELIERWFDE